MGDFNVEPTDTTLPDLYEIYNLKNTAKYKTCFKNPNKPSCIDLKISKKPKSFQIVQDELYESYGNSRLLLSCSEPSAIVMMVTLLNRA